MVETLLSNLTFFSDGFHGFPSRGAAAAMMHTAVVFSVERPRVFFLAAGEGDLGLSFLLPLASDAAAALEPWENLHFSPLSHLPILKNLHGTLDRSVFRPGDELPK